MEGQRPVEGLVSEKEHADPVAEEEKEQQEERVRRGDGRRLAQLPGEQQQLL